MLKYLLKRCNAHICSMRRYLEINVELAVFLMFISITIIAIILIVSIVSYAESFHYDTEKCYKTIDVNGKSDTILILRKIKSGNGKFYTICSLARDACINETRNRVEDSIVEETDCKIKR